MKTAILAIGNEVVCGDIINTNASNISKYLSKFGLEAYEHMAVKDKKKEINRALKTLFKKNDIIITTGGLGPTYDDITKKTVADFFDLKLILNKECLEELEEFFRSRNKIMTKNNESQCFFPKNSIIIPNKNGTAPGVIIKKKGKAVIMLPGPPNENIPMLREEVVTDFFSKCSDCVTEEKMLSFFGIGESQLADMLKDILKSEKNLSVATYIKTGEVQIKITAKAKTKELCNMMIEKTKEQILAIAGEYLYSEENEELEEALLKLLKEKNKKLITVESCTGGLIGKKITAVPGSSENYLGGLITYSNEMKMQLCNVSEETLSSFGAVSKATAIEMAEGAMKYCNADIAISVTGIAGPGGGSEEKPVGLVYIGIATKEESDSMRFYFTGNRSKVREQSAKNALYMAIKYLKTDV